MSDATYPIQLEDVHARYGRTHVLRGLTLRVPAEQTTALLGRNGAGKTTLLRSAIGLIEPDTGRIQVAGHDPVREPLAVQTRVGYVPDRPDVYPWLGARGLFRLLQVHQPEWDGQHAESLLEQLEVPPDRPFGKLSRGEGMKAMLAAALAPRPAVLLLDEPFGGLDPVVREEVLQSVIGALGERPRTVLIATHELELAARIGDRIALLAGGVIEREGTLEAFLGEDAEAGVPDALRTALANAGRGES